MNCAPDIAAVPATALSASSISPPALIPEVPKMEAILAASSREYAVPLTALLADFIVASTSMPSALNWNLACSIFRALFLPPSTIGSQRLLAMLRPASIAPLVSLARAVPAMTLSPENLLPTLSTLLVRPSSLTPVVFLISSVKDFNEPRVSLTPF